MKIVVSSCLLHLKCRYDGEKMDLPEFLIKNLNDHDVDVFGICPEFCHFHKAPREKIMLTASGEDVLDRNGELVFLDGKPFTRDFLPVMESLLAKIKRFNPDKIILKEKSPSCGLFKVFIHDSGWSEGMGVWAALLKKHISAEFYNENGEQCF